MRNKKNSLLTIVIILSFSLTLLISNGLSYKLILTEEDWLKYRVLASSDTENMFFGNWPPGSYYGNWSVIPEDLIMFNVSSVTSSEINGTLFLGNTINHTIFYDVRNIDVAFALGLSIIPWNGGFIANVSDWSNIETQVQGTNTTMSDLSNFEHTLNETLNSYEVKVFKTQDYNGQNSLFYYHSDTGVLLSASTSYESYELNITLVSTSLEINPTMKTSGFSFNLTIMSIALIPLFLLFKKKYLDSK